MIRKLKNVYSKEYFAKNSSNNKKLWAGINPIINKSNNKANDPVCIKIDVNGNVTTVTDSKNIANAFNSHYATVAEKILKKRKYRGKRRYYAYLKNPNPLSFMVNPTTPPEIEDIYLKSTHLNELDSTVYNKN